MHCPPASALPGQWPWSCWPRRRSGRRRPPSQDAGAQATEQQVVAPVDPIIAEVRRRLAEPARRDVHRGDRAALTAFYAARTGEPLWVTGSGLNMRAQDAIAEIRKAEDWGLSLAAFELPRPVAADASPATLADAEILVGLAVLEYARHARGGRLDPSSLSANFDVKPPVLDPKVVLEAVSDHRHALARIWSACIPSTSSSRGCARRSSKFAAASASRSPSRRSW